MKKLKKKNKTKWETNFANKEPILNLRNKHKKSLKRHSQLYKKIIVIDNKNNDNNLNILFDGKMKNKQKSTPIHFNNSLRTK